MKIPLPFTARHVRPRMAAMQREAALGARLALAGTLLATLVAPPVAAGPEAEKLAAFLDSLRVEELWLAGTHVNWRTGEPDAGPKSGSGTKSHCSAFVAAACERLGIYVLRPPEHGQVLLANAQYDWLASDGREAGWRPVRDAREAQRLANRGELVVAAFRSPDPKKAGHIAIVRPGHKAERRLEEEGPDVIQAGATNYVSTSMRNGFRHHHGAWESGSIRFYAHEVASR